MATLITMKNENTGLEKTAYVGFSWTSLLFGGIPAVFRGDWMAFFIYFAVNIIIGALTAGIASFLIWIIWPFVYNKWHARRLMEKGYVVIAAAGLDPKSVHRSLEV